jgi:hypothetical protein
MKRRALSFRCHAKMGGFGAEMALFELKTGQKWGSLFTEFTDMLIG